MSQMHALSGQCLNRAFTAPRSPARRHVVAPRNAVEHKPLPYPKVRIVIPIEVSLPRYYEPTDALAPKGMCEETLDIHWGRHHLTYVNNLNKQIEGKDLDNKTLEEIVVAAWNNGNPTPEFNNAAQIWNHEFFWESMSPDGGGEPSGELKAAIDKSFGSFEEFKKQFSAAGATQFGSGWAWLVKDGDKLAVTKTPNAENPVPKGQTPLLTMDVWEHAYYVDYRNKRPDFIGNFFNLINWDKVAERFAA